MFAIETHTINGWTDDPSLLGGGCTEANNRWTSEADALAACDELATVWGCPRSNLRVVPTQDS